MAHVAFSISASVMAYPRSSTIADVGTEMSCPFAARAVVASTYCFTSNGAPNFTEIEPNFFRTTGMALNKAVIDYEGNTTLSVSAQEACSSKENV